MTASGTTDNLEDKALRGDAMLDISVLIQEITVKDMQISLMCPSCGDRVFRRVSSLTERNIFHCSNPECSAWFQWHLTVIAHGLSGEEAR